MLTRLWRALRTPCIVAVTSAFLLQGAQLGLAEREWEMRVCAHPDDMPFSDVTREGYENKIAEVVAEELGATVEYVWTETGQSLLSDELWPGNCDVVFGVGDGGPGLSRTLPYYQSPFAFVYRNDAPFEISSLEDDVLQDLSLSTYVDSVIDRALGDYGLRSQVEYLQPYEIRLRRDYETPIIESVLSGDIDVGIIYGPVAGYFATHVTDELEVVPVEPAYVPPAPPLYRTATVGVRPGDEAFRDRLEVALANRAEEIQGILENYGVPTLPLPPVFAGQEDPSQEVRIGLVLPLPTGTPLPTDATAAASRIGAEVADALVGTRAHEAGLRIRFKIANAPGAEATRRAAERLIVTEDVTALIGGVGGEAASVLSDVADDREVLFFNIGAIDDRLRGARCRANTFHIEASASMYMDAALEWFSGEEESRWLFVQSEGDAERSLVERAVERFASNEVSGQVVGHVVVESKDLVFGDVVRQVEENDVDVVYLVLPPEQQEQVVAQLAHLIPHVTVTGLPHATMQTRSFWQRMHQVAGGQPTPRIALWDASLREGGAAELNDSFVGRSSQAMDPSGWATVVAVQALVEAVLGTEDVAVDQLRSHLASGEIGLDVGKGTPLTFRSWDHQLRQPLFVVQASDDAAWGRSASSRIAFVEAVGRIPSTEEDREDGTTSLDELGRRQEEPSCVGQHKVPPGSG